MTVTNVRRVPRAPRHRSAVRTLAALTGSVVMLLGFGASVAAAQPAPAPPDTSAVLESDPSTVLAGRTVFLDPGHQGGTDGNDLARQVPDGRGGTKDCQTTGMTALGGTPEHTITWNVAQLVESSLETLGARVVLSRADDTGWGGCIDERAAAASESGADLAVSIHADSTAAVADPERRGYHLIVPELPVPDAAADAAQRGGGADATARMKAAYDAAEFVPANYAGAADGIQTRADVAGPALTTVPLVFLEMGNGANPEDAAVLESQDGQVRHAIAITTGIAEYLVATPPASSVPAESAPAATPAPAPNTPAPNTPAPTTTTPAPPASDTPAAVPETAGPETPLLEAVLSALLAVFEPADDSDARPLADLLLPLVRSLS